MNKNKLIVIEGACDGIGKSTQSSLLIERLKNEGYNVVFHHFPSYNTFQGTGVSEYLSGYYGQINDLSPYFVNNLYAFDRMITWNKSLKNEEADIYFFDRYTTSSIIYQSAFIEDQEKKKEFINYVMDFEYNKLGIRKPDEVIFLNAPFEQVNNLRKHRVDNEGIMNDIHEKDEEFMRKVYKSALFASSYLKWHEVKCNIGDEMRSIEDIHEEIYNIVTK